MSKSELIDLMLKYPNLIKRQIFIVGKSSRSGIPLAGKVYFGYNEI
ncbi:MAG: hypothetical protein M1470_02125 [Bacteroidetes bacterium]|nr:hypothetical protein [Bacteroidota bacterium]MCL5737919.1 hypothetical protein [Bacteroidota bacterium]